jgi:hypothetical protein
MILEDSDNKVKRNIRVFKMGVGMTGKSLHLRAFGRNMVRLRYMLAEDFFSFEGRRTAWTVQE